jgi:hypothetical protein
MNWTKTLELVFGRKAKRPIDPPQRTTDVLPPRELPIRKRRQLQLEIRKGKRS